MCKACGSASLKRRVERGVTRREVLQAIPPWVIGSIFAWDGAMRDIRERRQAESSAGADPNLLRIHLSVLELPDSTNPGGLEARQQKMHEVLAHLGRVAGIASILSVERRTVQPDIPQYYNVQNGQVEACLSDQWINDHLAWRRTEVERALGGRVIMGAWANGILLEHDHTRSGVAYQDRENPRFVLSENAGMRACMHELLHLLGPDFQGLGHQWRFTTWRVINGKLVRAHGMDTIQQMVRDGCGLQMGANGLPEEYASLYSVMGASKFNKVMSGECQTSTPPITSLELGFIDQRRRLDEVSAAPGRYELSYDVNGRAGVVIDLSEDHVLRQIIPEAEQLCFGLGIPDVAYNAGHNCPAADPHDASYQSMLLPFVRWDGGRKSAVLDNASPWPWDIQERTAVYADEQLGLVAVAERREHDGKRRHVVEFLPLSSEEGQRLLHESRRRAEERNRLALGDE